MDNLAFRNDHMYAAPCSMTAASLQSCSVVSETAQQQNLSGICARSKPKDPKQENIQMSKDLKNAESSRKNSLCSGTEQRSGKLCPEKKDKGQISEPAPELKQICHGRAEALPDVADRDGKREESVKNFSVLSLDHQYHSLSDTVDKTHFQLAGNLSPVALGNQKECIDLNIHLSSGERVSLTMRNKATLKKNGGGCDNDKEDSVLNNESNETGNESDFNVSDNECEVTDKEQISNANKLHSSTLLECHVTCYRHVAEGDNSELCEPVDEIQQPKNASDKATEVSSLTDSQDKPAKDCSEIKELHKDLVNEKETQGSTEMQKKMSLGQKGNVRTSAKMLNTESSSNPKQDIHLNNEGTVVNPSEEKAGEDPARSDDLTKAETVTGSRDSEDIMDISEARQATDLAKPEKIMDSLKIVKDKDSLRFQRNAKEFAAPQKAIHSSEVLIDLSYTEEDMELSKAEKSNDSLKKGKRQETSDDIDLIKDSTIQSEGKKITKMGDSAGFTSKTRKQITDCDSVVESNESMDFSQESGSSGKVINVSQVISSQQESLQKTNQKRSCEEAGLSIPVLDANDEVSKVPKTDQTRSLKKSPSVTNRGASDTTLNKAQYLIPMKEHGWFREVVFRGIFTETSSGQKPADIYYFTPEKRKLRSKVQVAQYLRDHPSVPLTEENFTFLRIPLFEEPWESVRNAWTSRRVQPVSRSHKDKTPARTTSKTPARTTSKYDGSHKQQSKPSDHFSDSSMTSSPSDIKCVDKNNKEWSFVSGPSTDSKKAKVVTRSRGRGRGWLRGSWEVKEAPHEMEVLIQDLPPPEIIIDRADDGEDLSLGEESQEGSQTEMQMQGSPDKNVSEPPFEPVHFDRAPIHLQHPPSRVIKATARKSTTPHIKFKLPSSKSRSTRERSLSVGQLCSNSCPGLNGQPPELQCCVCMCLFHHQCVNTEKSSQGATDQFRCLRCINMPTPPPSVSPPSKSAGASASRHEQAPAPPIPTPPSPAVLSMPAPQLTIIHQPSGVIPLFLPLMPGPIACQQLPVQSGSTTHSGQLVQPADGSNSDAIQVLRGMVGKHDQPVSTSQPLPSMPGPPRLLMRGAVPPPLTPSSKVNPTQGIVTAFRPPPRLVAAPGIVASTATPAVTVSGSLSEEAASSFTVTAPLSRSMSTVSSFAEKNSIPLSIPAPSASTLMVTSLAEKTSKAPVNPAPSVSALTVPSPAQKHVVSLLSPALSASTLAFATHPDKDPLVLPSLAPSESTPAIPSPAGENLLPLPVPALSTSTTAAASVPFGKNSLTQPSPAQLLTLPASILKRVNVNQPLALKINNRHIIVPPYCLLKSKDAVKVVLPPGTFSMPPNSETTFPLTVSNNTLTTPSPVTMTTVNLAATAEQGTQLEAKASDEPSTSYAQATVDVPSTSDDPFISVLASDIPSTSDAYASLDVPSSSDDSSLNRSKSSKHVSSGKCQLRAKSHSQINPSQCMMHRLFGGFDAMLQIFRFLQIPDLLHASQVCSTWLQIARQRTLWQSVNLKDLLVADWEMALKFMRSCGTQKLLLKGVKHKGSQSQAWQSLLENLDLLVGLRHVEFGLVPAAVVHAVVEKLTQLEVFKAEHITLFADIYSEQMWTTPTKLDVGKFGSLVHLQELRLRGVLGLVLPTFTFNGSLSELAHLKHLRFLSLTSLHAMRDSDFNFLADMKHLRELELGNCLNWTSQTYLLLGELRELRHLRLECGGEIPDVGLGDALSNLTKLERLELILFVIPASLNKALSELTCLHTLVLWPDTGCGILPATVNSNAVAAVLNVKQLHVLEWGLMVKDSSAHSKLLLQQTEDNSTIPVLCNGCSLDPDFQHSNDAIMNLTVKEFTERLCSALPLCTNIRVFSTQVVGRRQALCM